MVPENKISSMVTTGTMKSTVAMAQTSLRAVMEMTLFMGMADMIICTVTMEMMFFIPVTGKM